MFGALLRIRRDSPPRLSAEALDASDGRPMLVHKPSSAATGRVDASIVVVTRNRAAEAVCAVQSALRQTGCATEVIVVDDGSTDGTAESLRAKCPEAWIYRDSVPRGPAARRNFAASVAHGEFLVGIDDDAELIDPQTVSTTVHDFDVGDDIGAVAIPCTETTPEGNEVQLYPPLSEANEVLEAFVGAGYAVRRQLFMRVGGYSEHLFYYGEERDLAVRLLQVGSFVRLGSAPAVVHRPSQVRRDKLRAFYGRRNDVLFAWQRVPVSALPLHALRTAIGALVAAQRIHGGRDAGAMLRGVLRGYRDAAHLPRAPLDTAVYKLSLRLRRQGPMPLAEARVRLSGLVSAPATHSIRRNGPAVHVAPVSADKDEARPNHDGV